MPNLGKVLKSQFKLRLTHSYVLSHFSHVQLFATPCNPPVSSVHGILQARILEWVSVPSSRGSS